jgi:hypothetical protein
MFGRGRARFRWLERSPRGSVRTLSVAKKRLWGDCGAREIACYAEAMGDRYRLGGLGNDQLLAALSGLVRREHDLMSDLLAHLAELDERRRYLDLGFTSLFAYCTEALGFCKSSAGRRIAVARVCRKYPEAFARIARGELQLSALSLLAPHLSQKNATELFEACKRKSCDQVEELLAARFPKRDVRDSIRRLPPRPEAGTPMEGACPRLWPTESGLRSPRWRARWQKLGAKRERMKRERMKRERMKRERMKRERMKRDERTTRGRGHPCQLGP